MSKYSKILGIALIVLGLASFLGTGAEHFTAFIPALFGLIFFALGFVADKSEDIRKHSMHAAMLLAIIGIAGSFGGLMSLFGAIGGETLERPAAAYSQALMAILCIVFLVLGVRSFIKARGEMA